MKIGIITDPMDTMSSVRVYLSNLLENLFRLHDPSQIYLIHARKNDNPLYQQANEIVLPGFYRHNAPSAVMADVLRPFLLRKHKLDVLHYTHSNVPLTYFAAGTRNVCLMTTIGAATHPQYYARRSQLMIRIAKVMNRRLDMLITESEAEKKAIVSFLSVPEDRVRVIPSGVDDIYHPLSNLDEAKAELAAKYGIDSPFVLHIGAYRPVKNGPGLVRAFGELKRRGIEHKLVLVGKPSARFSEVTDLVRELKLESEVITTDFVRRDDLPKFYNAASLFILPSFKESFPHVLVEALACGCAVVTSDIACMTEIAGDAGIAVDPYDIGALAEAMHRVLTDDQLRQKMQRTSLERAGRFSWERCAQETLDLYGELCRNGSGKEA